MLSDQTPFECPDKLISSLRSLHIIKKIIRVDIVSVTKTDNNIRGLLRCVPKLIILLIPLY